MAKQFFFKLVLQEISEKDLLYTALFRHGLVFNKYSVSIKKNMFPFAIYYLYDSIA